MLRARSPPADLANLTKIADQIAGLNLRRSGLTDAELKTIAGFKNLRVLRLQDTPITDAGVTQLAALKELRQLTLAGTKVSDSGLAQLASLPNLKSLYIWNTGATPAAVDKLKAGKKDLVVVAGLSRAEALAAGRAAPADQLGSASIDARQGPGATCAGPSFCLMVCESDGQVGDGDGSVDLRRPGALVPRPQQRQSELRLRHGRRPLWSRCCSCAAGARRGGDRGLGQRSAAAGTCSTTPRPSP